VGDRQPANNDERRGAGQDANDDDGRAALATGPKEPGDEAAAIPGHANLLKTVVSDPNISLSVPAEGLFFEAVKPQYGQTRCEAPFRRVAGFLLSLGIYR
jgi:hypothetical protein